MNFLKNKNQNFCLLVSSSLIVSKFDFIVLLNSEEGRETHDPEGRAHPPVVWDFYNNGCSIRMINPQTFSDNVWRECATLQEFMGSMVGANVYLTPPGTQVGWK